MISRTFRARFESPASASDTWAYLSDPARVAASSSHPTVAAIEGPLQQGSVWTEYHSDEGCDFDSVQWRCTAIDPGRRIVIEGLQSGSLQRAATELHVVDDLVEVESTLLVRPAVRAPGSLVERALVPVMLLLPFGRALLEEGFQESVEDDRRALAALAG